MPIKKYGLLLFVFVILTTLSCKKDEEPELPPLDTLTITTLQYTLMTSGEDPVVLSYRDLDGNGGDDPIIEGGTLKANTIYFGSLELSNESEDPAEDITKVIEDDLREYQFFFILNDLNLNVSYADVDGDGNPVGLFTAVNTAEAESGNLVINLQQDPNKLADGVRDGELLNALGTTAIQVSFPVTIQ